MSKYIDYEDLRHKIMKTRYKLSEVAHKIEKVAFDVVKFKDDDLSNLWEVKHEADGDYLVALYDKDPEEIVAESAWDVQVSKLSSDLSIFYKGEAVVKIASSRLGIPEDELGETKKYLPKRLSENKKLIQSLLKLASKEVRDNLLLKFPELKG